MAGLPEAGGAIGDRGGILTQGESMESGANLHREMGGRLGNLL
jgi:hypothetical protein